MSFTYHRLSRCFRFVYIYACIAVFFVLLSFSANKDLYINEYKTVCRTYMSSFSSRTPHISKHATAVHACLLTNESLRNDCRRSTVYKRYTSSRDEKGRHINPISDNTSVSRSSSVRHVTRFRGERLVDVHLLYSVTFWSRPD